MSAEAPYQPLLDLATPDIYRRNPFRVLGLSPRASTQEAHRAAKRRKMKGKLGMAASTFVGGAANAPAALTEAEIDAAMERLTHPSARLLDEIFWFWPTDTGTAEDPAILAWTQGQEEAARTHWQTQTQRADLAPLATHNLAVLDHLSALDQEQRLSAAKEGASSQLKKLAAVWQRAFSFWDRVIKDVDFWKQVEARICDLNDAQLRTQLVRPLRETMPLALSVINARLAYAAAEGGNGAGAQRQLRILRASTLDDQASHEALNEVLKPLRARVTTSCEQARARWAAAPHQANRHIRDLHTQVQPLLAIANCLLPQTDFARTGLHDLVAQAILDGEAAFSNKTNDWQEGLALLALAETIAVGEPVREKVAKNIEINQKNIESGNDWCSPGYWDLPVPTVETLEAARKKAMSGDYDGAIAALAVMEAALGKPLRRCLAYALSRKAIRTVNQALDDYNAETEKIKKIMDRLRGMSAYEQIMFQANQPDPNGLRNPPCMTGCGRPYTSWVKFIYRDNLLFMCSSCNAEDERESAGRKAQLRKELTVALENLLLASEFEQPADRGVARNLTQLRATATQFSCPVPDTSGLRQRLDRTDQGLNGIADGLDAPGDGAVCHFCGQNPASESARIAVRLSSPTRTVALLLGSRTEFSYCDVVVPRCPHCRNTHRQSPVSLADWQRARDAAVADERFPTLVSELTAANAAVGACRARKKTASRSVRRSKWLRGMTVAAYPLAMLGFLLLTLPQLPDALYWGALRIESISGWNADESVRYLPFIVAVLAGPVLGWGIARRFRPRQVQRLREVQAELASANEALQAATGTQEVVQSRLDAAKTEALAVYRQTHPAPEAAYIDYPAIAARRTEGWSIGMHVGTAKAHEISRTSEHVSGLVAG